MQPSDSGGAILVLNQSQLEEFKDMMEKEETAGEFTFGKGGKPKPKMDEKLEDLDSIEILPTANVGRKTPKR